MTAAGAVGLGVAPGALSAARLPPPPADERLRILILGGTGFTGPAQVQYALDRGHEVTLFNRGRTNPGLFRGKVEELLGDRNDNLEALKGRSWDVVIDNPTTLPRWVRDVGQILQGRADQYIFISTISVYAENHRPGADETDAVARYEGADAMAETLDTLRGNMGLYGPLKALSEQEAEKWFPGRTTIIRPGLIVGPGDQTDRFNYWPLRIVRGGEVLAPGQPEDPVQIIDGRDLGEWVIRMAEQRTAGVFNATGPRSRLSIAEMLHGIRAITSAPVSFTWVPAEFLETQGVRPWGHMPVWVPPVGPMAGFAQRNIEKAVAHGLTFRPLADTARDTLAWFATLPEERRNGPLRAGLPASREQEVLAAWHARPRT
jgi:2'-hydroxyisoflavone reductase